jgi:hypothetical protein
MSHHQRQDRDGGGDVNLHGRDAEHRSGGTE